MGNYEQLKAAIEQVIKTNGNNEITGAILQNTLKSIVNSVGANATFAGIATPETDPGTPDQNVFYLATQAGTYTNFGGMKLNEGLNILRWNSTSWAVTNVMNIVQELGNSDNKVMSQKAVTDLVSEYNVSVLYPTGGIDGTNRYTLETAIAKVPAALRRVGIKCSFIGEDGTPQTWEWLGPNFTTLIHWDKTVNKKELTLETGYGQFGYAKDYFVAGSTGKISSYKGLGVLTIPYNSGDVIEIVGAVDPDGPGRTNSSYNFYRGETYLGGSDSLDNIPEGTDTIRINTNYVSSDGVECVIINGKPYNIRSLVYRLQERVTDIIADAMYPTFYKGSIYPKGRIVTYNGDVYRFTTDHAAGEWTGKDVEMLSLPQRWKEYAANDYYYYDFYIHKDTGRPTYFGGLKHIEFPYHAGDKVEIQHAANGTEYNRYNFFKGHDFLGSANDETWSTELVPEGTDTIKVNGSRNNTPIVIVNGIGINRTSEAYRINLEVNDLNEQLNDLNEQVNDLNEHAFTEYTSLITDYGKDDCLNNPDPSFVTIEQEGNKYRVTAINNSKYSFIAKSKLVDESLLVKGRRLAYFVDVDLIRFPEGGAYTYGSIDTNIGRKKLDVKTGQRLRSVCKVELAADSYTTSQAGLIFTIANADILNQQWEYLYHAFAIIDCGMDSSNPLYDLTEDEILNRLGNDTFARDNRVFAPRTVAVSGIRNNDGVFSFLDDENNVIATLEKDGLKVSDVKSLDNKELYSRKKLFGKEFFTVGDSLCSNGRWQPRFAELTGSTFDKAYNKDNISVGGTRSLGASAYSGQNRLKKLVEEKSPKIIILENINDIGAHDIDEVDYSYMISETSVSQTIYDDAASARAAKSSEIALIPEQSRSIGHALRIGYRSETGVKLTISGVAEGNRTCIVRVGRTSAQIEINTGDTAADVVAKIYEVYWEGYEKFTDNVTYVAFVNSDGGKADIGTFMLDGNGIAVTEDTYASTSYVDYYFIGQTVDEPSFNDASNWTENVPMVAVYKGMFEYIFSKLPTCRVIWFIPTRLAIQWNEGEHGWDAGLWLEKEVRVNMQYYQNSYSPKVTYDSFREFQKKVAEMYGVEVYDINDVCGINPYNHKTFYPSYNVHPLQAGYDRWAETFARMLK